MRCSSQLPQPQLTSVPARRTTPILTLARCTHRSTSTHLPAVLPLLAVANTISPYPTIHAHVHPRPCNSTPVHTPLPPSSRPRPARSLMCTKPTYSHHPSLARPSRSPSTVLRGLLAPTAVCSLSVSNCVSINKCTDRFLTVSAGPTGSVISGPSAIGGGGFPPTNEHGQRICRQCGLPGRYKEGKCVEKWGPGPEGPGTVCDRYAARFARYFIFFC